MFSLSQLKKLFASTEENLKLANSQDSLFVRDMYVRDMFAALRSLRHSGYWVFGGEMYNWEPTCYLQGRRSDGSVSVI